MRSVSVVAQHFSLLQLSTPYSPRTFLYLLSQSLFPSLLLWREGNTLADLTTTNATQLLKKKTIIPAVTISNQTYTILCYLKYINLL